MNYIEKKAGFYKHLTSTQTPVYGDYEIVPNFYYTLEIADVPFPVCGYCGYDGGVRYNHIEVYNDYYDEDSDYFCRSCVEEGGRP